MRIFDTEELTTPIPARASRPTRLFVVEDSDVVRALWRTVAANIPGLYLAGEFNSASAAIRQAPPDVLLLDIHVCESEGMEVLRVIATDYPMTKVIVVSNCTELTHRQFWTKWGAYTFCDKGRGLAATRCMRCMLEGLAGQIDNQTSLMTRISKWSRTAHGTRH